MKESDYREIALRAQEKLKKKKQEIEKNEIGRTVGIKMQEEACGYGRQGQPKQKRPEPDCLSRIEWPQETEPSFDEYYGL